MDENGIPDWILQLQPGDQVRWTDPDDDTCSKVIEILEIHISGEIIRIVDRYFDVTECFASELS